MQKHTSAIFFAIIMMFAVSTAGQSFYINKARQLTLESERLKVSQILNQGIKRSQSAEQREALKKTLSQLMKVFYTEKAQSSFEQAKSFRSEKNDIAENKFKEALEIEPYNNQVLIHAAQRELYDKKCRPAIRKLMRVLKLNPYDKKAKSLLFFGYSCEEAWQELEKELLASARSFKGDLSYLSATAEFDYEKGALNKVLSVANKMLKIDSSFPLAYYWRWKILSSQERPGRIEAMKYVEVCSRKTLTFTKVKYFLLPQTCHYSQEVEEYLAALEKK